MINSIVEIAAASSQRGRRLISRSSMLAIIGTRPPPRIAGVMKKPSVRMNTRMAPAASEGRVAGRTRARTRSSRRHPRGRGLEQSIVQFEHRGEQRQDEKRQQNVGGAEDHAELVVKEAHRGRRQSESLERAVDDAVVAEDHDPGVGAHEDADPKWQHHEGERDQLAAGDRVRIQYASG